MSIINNNNVDFNSILDVIFNTQKLTFEHFCTYFPNDMDSSIKLFFISIIKEFSPTECIILFNNSTSQNSTLASVFIENLQTIISHHSLKSIPILFSDQLQQIITKHANNSSIMNITLKSCIFILEHKTTNTQYLNSFSTALKFAMFSPIDKIAFNELSMPLIEAVTSKMFKMFEMKNTLLIGMFGYDSICQIIDSNESKFCDVCVLYFIYNVLFHINELRDKYCNDIKNCSNVKVNQMLKWDFSNLEVYQEHFYSKFSFKNMYWKYCVNTSQCFLNNYKIENMLIELSSNIQQYFVSYDITKKDIEMNNIYDNYNTYQLEQHLTQMFQFQQRNGIVNSNVNIIDKWRLLFNENPYKVVITTVKLICNVPLNSNNDFNYYDFDSIYNSIIKSFKIYPNLYSQILQIFTDCLIILSLMFNSDMKNYFFILNHLEEPITDTTSLHPFIITFNLSVINAIYQIKIDNNHLYHLFSSKITALINMIIYTHPKLLLSLIDSTHNQFNEKLLTFLVNEIEASFPTFRILTDSFLKYDKTNPPRILNSLLFLGHLSCKYPLEDLYKKSLDFLVMLEKSIDLRNVLIDKNNIDKLLKGLFLLFKAFPEQQEKPIHFARFVSDSVDNWISEYTLVNYAKDQIGKLLRFVQSEISNGKFRNNNTLLFAVN